MEGSVPNAVAASVRAAFEWPIAAAGLRGVAFIGPEGSYSWGEARYDKAGFRGWALLAEVEGHARTPSLQGFARAGLGIGQIQKISDPFDYSSFVSLDGSIGPACKLSLGIRVAVSDSFWLGVEGGFLWFVRVRHVDSDPQLPRLRPEPLVPAGMVLLTVGMRARP
jgi:hypothetical protein